MPKNPFAIVVLVLGLILMWDLYMLFGFLLGPNGMMFFGWQIFLQNLPTFSGVAGLIIFIVSKFKKDQLFKAYLCYNVFIIPFWLMGLKSRFDRAELYERDLFENTGFNIHLALTVLMFVTSIAGLWMMRKRSTPLLAEVTIDDKQYSEFKPVRKGTRFLNRLIDLVIIAAVLYYNIMENYFFRDTFRGTGEGMLLLIEVLTGFYFYVVLEGVFNTSIGKAFTKTMVVNYEGNKPGFFNIVGRTFCRFIPFEPFSFLGAEPRGWHDTISNTYVVKQSMERG